GDVKNLHWAECGSCGEWSFADTGDIRPLFDEIELPAQYKNFAEDCNGRRDTCQGNRVSSCVTKGPNAESVMILLIREGGPRRWGRDTQRPRMRPIRLLIF